MINALKYHPDDNVLTVLEQAKPGDLIVTGKSPTGITSLDSVPVGHKVAERDITAGEPIVKYGQPVGTASRGISKGEYVHVHNVVDPVSDWKSRESGHVRSQKGLRGIGTLCA